MADKYPHWYVATINTEALWSAADKWSKRTGKDFSDKMEVLYERLLRLQWVNDVCFDHQCWVRCDFETSREDVAARRVALTKAKIERIRQSMI